MGRDSRFSSIPAAVAAIARGDIVIVVDDPGRENEGDFVMAADMVTADAVNFMVTHGRGLVCLPMASERIDALGLRAMVPGPPDGGGTAFTVSIDLLDPPNTGISAHDRARCIRRAIEPDARLGEFRLGGHIFPLRARPGGVLARPGHTEAAVDLARMAGRTPAGVICEILRADGRMARVPGLLRMAEELGMPIVTIADLRAHRLRTETLVERGGTASLPTPYGTFRARAYTSTVDGVEHVALVYGDPRAHPGPLVRLHSECLTGDALSSVRCDCGAQLREAQRLIAADGAGAIVYIRGHEGRGIGLVQKMRAYTLQDRGLDTVEANLALGLPADARTYGVAAHVLRDLGLQAVRLLTNNPAKRAGLEEAGMTVLDRIPLETTPTVHNLPYLEAKRDKLGHHLALA